MCDMYFIKVSHCMINQNSCDQILTNYGVRNGDKVENGDIYCGCEIGDITVYWGSHLVCIEWE